MASIRLVSVAMTVILSPFVCDSKDGRANRI